MEVVVVLFGGLGVKSLYRRLGRPLRWLGVLHVCLKSIKNHMLVKRTVFLAWLLSDGEGLILRTQMDRKALYWGANIDLCGIELAFRFRVSTVWVFSWAAKSCHFTDHLERDSSFKLIIVANSRVDHLRCTSIGTRLCTELAIVHCFFESDHRISLGCPV